MGTSTKADQTNAKTLRMFDRAIKLTPERMIRAFKTVLADLEGQGRLRAPIRFGFLRASMEPLPIRVERVGDRMRLVGGVAARTPYAWVQHEHSEYNHPLGGEDHYLIKPLQEREKRYRALLARAAMDALKEASRG